MMQWLVALDITNRYVKQKVLKIIRPSCCFFSKKGGPRSKTRRRLNNSSSQGPRVRQESKSRKDTSTRADQASIDQAPPLFLLPTASRNAFVARIAVEESDLDHFSLFEGLTNSQQQPTRNHPPQLASSLSSIGSGATLDELVVSVPPFFRRGHFEALTAKDVSTNILNAVRFNQGGQSAPEVAFLGRSNVGKSTLVNGLMRVNLAVTSKHPGRTQQPYYYAWLPENVDKVRRGAAKGYFVDLPGYGYAIGPDDAIERWQKQTQQFLLQRHEAGSLKRLFLLQDARVGPLPFDISIQSWFEEAGIPYSIVLTKSDGVSPPVIIKHVNHLCMRYHHEYTAKQDASKEGEDDWEIDHIAMSPIIHVTSARTGCGLSELLYTIEADFLLTSDTRIRNSLP